MTQDPQTGDVVLSRRPTTWDSFFVARKGVHADFLDKEERHQGKQNRDPFNDWNE